MGGKAAFGGVTLNAAIASLTMPEALFARRVRMPAAKWGQMRENRGLSLVPSWNT